jgi:cytochrome c oxidase subunit 2
MKSAKSIVLAMAIVAMAALLAACGGNNAPPSSGAPSSGASGSEQELKVTASDFKYDPNTFTVKAGQKTKVTMTNKGAVDHTWVVSDSSGAVIYKMTVAVGKTGSGEFTLPAAGTYTLVCDVPGHKEAGMQGKITAQ